MPSARPETRYAKSGDLTDAVPPEDPGTHELEGVPGEWRLYSVAA